ncbi:hypothetical protein BGX28_008109 [Mortierella sp. GBA30]|nr:hypothetical protein BGX28_008109 [Mortierella sp. GBA30]
MRGVQGGTPEVKKPMEFLEQHHKKTMNKTTLQLNTPENSPPQSNINSNHNIIDALSTHGNHNQQALFSSGFDYPLSGDESDNHHNQMEQLRSQFYTPDPQKRTKEYHIEQSHQAIELLKAASRTHGWKRVDKHKSGCIVYQSTSSATLPGHGDDKCPAFKSEHFIRGFKAQDVYSIVSTRKLWDDWYDELSCVETYDEATALIYMVMRSTLPSKTRDVAMIERLQIEKDGTYYLADCSVESNKIPRIPGKVRAVIFLAGWIIQPLPSNPPITKVTYVIQTDLLSKLPRFIAKRSLIKRALVITTVENHLRKNGVPVVSIPKPHIKQRPRSLSEPVRLEQYMLPQDSDGELTDDLMFTSPVGPVQDLEDGIESEYEDEIQPTQAHAHQQHNATANTSSMNTSDSFMSSTSQASQPSQPSQPSQHSQHSQHSQPSQAFVDSGSLLGGSLLGESLLGGSLLGESLLGESMLGDSLLGDETLFESSPLFSKGEISEPGKKQELETFPWEPLRPSQTSPAKHQKQQKQQQQKQQQVQEQQQLQARASLERSRTLSPESAGRLNQKRVSIPVVQPKSEARTKQYSGSPSSSNPSSDNLSSAGSNSSSSDDSQSTAPVPTPTPSESSTLLMPMITPATPPLTPTASIDGRDTTSDSDAAQSVKVVSRSPKTSTSSEEANTSRPGSLAMSSLGMKTPSAMMEARRHSGLNGRSSSSAFVPRHSHVVPIRGNPNVSLQSLTRASGPNGTMTTAIKRHSTAPSIDSNRSLTAFQPVMVLPHRHSETARKALAMFKVLASSSEDRWRAISSENGFKSYSRIISGAGLPMLRGEGTITGGWTVEQINAVIESTGCRQVWDERFENLSIAETFNHNEYLFHIVLRGVGSLTGRDLAGVTIIDRDPLTAALYNVSTSVLDPTIPEDPGRIRAMLELSGWSLRPTFDGQGNTVSVNVTFVIQIDIRGNLPSAVVKSMTASMAQAVSRLNQFINKSGYPPFASHISGTRLLDTFVPNTGFYELCYKAAPGWTEVRVGRKVYKEGYDFFIKPDDPSVRVELAPDFGGVRIWTTLDHEGQSIIAQVSRKGQNTIEAPETEAVHNKQGTETEHTKAKSESKKGDPVSEDIVADKRHSIPAGRKRRSASFATMSAQVDPSSFTSRPDSTASVASRASQGSEKGRARGRTPRNIVTLPAGTPPPPLPRRSSSLSRYSIPISSYLPGADAPPVPSSSNVAAAATAAEIGVRLSRASGMESLPSSSSVASPVSTCLTSPTSPRPVVESPLGSPTLGPFHVPHTVTTDVPALVDEIKTTGDSVIARSGQMESISTVLAENNSPTTPVLEPMPEALMIAAAMSTPKSEAKAMAALNASEQMSTPSPKERKRMQIISSLASQDSPMSSPVPSSMMAFSLRSSSMPVSPPSSTSTVSSTSSTTSTAIQPTSSLKHSTSSISLGNAGGLAKKRDVRVTFSLDTFDNTSDTTESDNESLGRDTGRHLERSNSPLDKILQLNNNNNINSNNKNNDDHNSNHSHSSIHAPSMARKHSVQVVSAHHLQYATVVEEMNSDSESDEAEFVEARDELSEDEVEFALVLAGIGSWPSSSFNNGDTKMQEKKDSGEKMVASTMLAIEQGLRQLAAASSTQLKVGIVFVLLVYYAGRLSSLIA